MAGGKQAINIFRLNRGDDPKEVLNWKLWLSVFSFGIMGAARGVDEGLISGTLDSAHFRQKIGMVLIEDGGSLTETDFANMKANISAMVQIGSVGGALIAFLLCDRIGRLWATRQLCLTWIFGILLFLFNGGRLGQVYAGRFIAGLGIGQTTVVAPVYLSEISPKSVRGLCTCCFSGAVYVGIMLAYFSSWGASIHLGETTKRWAAPTSVHLIFAGIILLLSFLNYESPRFLIKKGNDELATTNLARVRGLPVNDPHVTKEISEIQEQLREEIEATKGQGWMGIVREIFFMPNNLYRIYLGLGSQLLSQWSGAGSITLYAPDFFALLGTTGQDEKLFATAIFGLVKFVSSIICAFFLVDVIGRKRSLSIGIFLQSLSMIYIAIFLTVVGDPEKGRVWTASEKSASTGAIVMIYVSGFGWAMGWNSMQYLLNAEIYPLRIRAASSSIVMCFHFVNQYGNSRAVPIMLLPPSSGGMGPTGTFWFFGAITIIGGIWAWFTIPETAGRSLESMDRLFELRWWQIGTMGQKDADEKLKRITETKSEGNATPSDEKASQSEKSSDIAHVERA